MFVAEPVTQANICSNDGQVFCSMYASLGLDNLHDYF